MGPLGGWKGSRRRGGVVSRVVNVSIIRLVRKPGAPGFEP